MTITTYLEKKCGICKKSSTQKAILYADPVCDRFLDFRATGSINTHIDAWVQSCPHCGFVSTDISERVNLNPSFLESADFLECKSLEFANPLSKVFFRYYLLSLLRRKQRKALLALLWTSWSCDDFGDAISGIKSRSLCINMIESSHLLSRNPTYQLLRADLLRRTGQFHNLWLSCSHIVYPSLSQNSILLYQLALSEKEDSSAHLISEAKKYTLENN